MPVDTQVGRDQERGLARPALVCMFANVLAWYAAEASLGGSHVH